MTYAAQKGQLGCVKILVKHGARSTKRAKELALQHEQYLVCDYLKILEESIKSAREKLISSIQEKDAVTLAEVLKGNSKHLEDLFPLALYSAAECGFLEGLKLLVTEGANVSQPTPKGGLAIRTASFNGHLACVEFLLEEKSDLSLLNTDQMSALYWASQKGPPEIVETLLAAQAAQADTEVKNKDSKNCLALGCRV